MRHLVRNTCLVLALLMLAAASIYPPSENLRQGKDLRGGFSLVYQLQIAADENAGEVMSRTITVLKDRVDPDGLLEISIVPQGRDRLEITMPLPSDRVKALRQTYEDALAEIAAREISPQEVDRAIALPAAEREAEFERLSAGLETRLAAFERAAEAFDTEREAGQRLDRAEASDPPAPDEVVESILVEIGAARIRLNDARQEILDTVVRAEDLRNALSLSDEQRLVLDDDAPEPFPIPSPRSRALEDIREAHADQIDAIESVLTAFESYQSERSTLDDPSDLIRLLQGSGVLEFRIAPRIDEHPDEQQLRQELRESGPRAATAPDAIWLELADPTAWVNTIQQAEFMLADPAAFFRTTDFVVEEYEGQLYMLLYDRRDKALLQENREDSWRVASAFEQIDENGAPAVGFRMDPAGARLLGRLTEQNLGERMGVVLDDRAITAPTLQGKITSSGQITGINSPSERRDIIRTLNAGTLSASLTPRPISQSILGPELGQDNLDAGLRAGLIALIIVSGFMIVYYFTSGAIAVTALACNALLILAMLSLGRAALTLPGIAGIILTFGMAVDANVLIFERIREEIRNGANIKKAVQLGFDKALSSIVDGNVTNLIVCLVLANIGTQEIRGFAITLGIGVVGTLFTALVISRILFAWLITRFGVGSLPSLPGSVPALERALEPKIDWLSIRVPAIVVSACFVGLGITMIVRQGPEMLDNEFRGGTAVTMVFRQDDAGQRLTMARPEVAERIAAIAENAGPDSPLGDMVNAEVLPVNPQGDGVTSTTFKIKTLSTDQNAVSTSLQEAFADVLPTKPPLSFESDLETNVRQAPVFPITETRLGATIRRAGVITDVSAYDGGVAIVMENIQPRVSEDDLFERLEFMRRDAEFSDYLGRPHELVILEGTPESIVSAALVVSDPDLSVYDSQDRWWAEVAATEWDLVSKALKRSESLAGVDSFDASIAGTFRARAVAAVFLSFVLITIYIWVRFGSVRYSMAAIAALLHDVMIAIGLIALAEILYENQTTADLARSVNILPFKIDLSLVAALLTIIGYSLNDSIIIMDRIRENRGKLDYASRRVVNLSINQTLSRTVITSGTTLLAVGILYTSGGEGVRAFSFTLLIGVIVGTYSSVAVAAPLVWSGKKDPTDEGGPVAVPPAPVPPSPAPAGS
ncbi:MAG: protein translocase subunit SecD [Planctomycetota bacterium]